jgi:hypothetical protein
MHYKLNLIWNVRCSIGDHTTSLDLAQNCTTYIQYEKHYVTHHSVDWFDYNQSQYCHES